MSSSQGSSAAQGTTALRSESAEPSSAGDTYRDFHIHYDPPPIPVRDCDWHWVHVDYDGPEDNRYGHAPSFEAAKADVDEWWDDHGA